jgi:hypothetical protein
MSEKKPNVVPTKQQIDAASDEKSKLAAYEAEKAQVTNEIYSNSMSEETPYAHMSAVEQMRFRTEQQLNQKNNIGIVKDPNLAEKPTGYMQANQSRNEEQVRLRDEQLEKNKIQTENYHRMSENLMNQTAPVKQTYEEQYVAPSTPVYNSVPNYGVGQPSVDPYLLEIMQPNYNSAFDVIPLPSKGKMYKNKKSSIKVSYLTTADESILTSANLLESGQFLEILLNRKILEPDLRYRDLLPGDRNAIMVWLRATAYGEMYPVTILDEDNIPFDVELNLNDLKTKEMLVEPDQEGLFSYILPLSKAHVKFKILTCGEISDVENIILSERERKVPIDNSKIYTLERMIVDINGSRDKNYIRDFANSMRISDGKALEKFMESIDYGIEQSITVGTPGGGSIDTFLPFNTKFFWPDFKL